MAARIAMTIAHADRLPGHGELDRPTETTSIVGFWTGHNGFLRADCNAARFNYPSLLGNPDLTQPLVHRRDDFIERQVRLLSPAGAASI